MQRSIEGLWTFEAISREGWPVGGAVVLIGGRLLGGGSHYYYAGTYREHDRVFEGKARAFHFQGPATSPFGDTSPDYHVVFRGRRLSDVIDGEAYRPENPQMKQAFRLVWRAAIT
jgi:hypothetical protein